MFSQEFHRPTSLSGTNARDTAAYSAGVSHLFPWGRISQLDICVYIKDSSLERLFCIAVGEIECERCRGRMQAW